MKKEIEAFILLWKSDDSPLRILIYGVLTLILTPLAMVWRMLCSVAIIILGVLKIFKPRPKRYKPGQIFKCDRCPDCGSELTYYNHVAGEEEGTYYIKCACGYDSRYDK